MVVDSSAVLAILFQEPDAERFSQALAAAPTRISAASVVETGIVLNAKRGPEAEDDFDELLDRMRFCIEPVTAEHARLARRAFRVFGKGNHPAGLNFGDCFAYALAKATGEPLLFKGDDFARTDIPPALPARI